MPCPKALSGSRGIRRASPEVSKDWRKLQLCQRFPSLLARDLTAGKMSYSLATRSRPALLAALSPTARAAVSGLSASSPTAPKSTDGLTPTAAPSMGPWQLSFTYSSGFPIHLQILTFYMRKMRSSGYDGPNTDSDSGSSSH